MAAQDVSAMPNPDRPNITEHPTGEENEVIALVLIFANRFQAIVYFHEENI